MPGMPSGHPGMPSGHPATATAHKSALTWKAPATWKVEAPANRYRRAQYRLPGAGKAEAALMIVSHFPGMGGSTADNIARWHKQLETTKGAPAPKTSTRKVGALEVTTTFAVGAYLQPKNPMNMRGPVVKRDGWALLGAIVTTPTGPWFFKAVGPKETLETHRAAFDKLLGTVALRGDAAPKAKAGTSSKAAAKAPVK
jgi:hypothetical protein